MAEFDAKEIARATGGLLKRGARSKTRGVSVDSRKIPRGALFVAIKGERYDGHGFVTEAFAKGAGAAVISDRRLAEALSAENKTLIVVDDTTRALQDLAAFHRRRFRRLKVIAVTGSNGKTTVKEMTAAAVARKFRTLKTKGNLNNHIGLPLTLLRLRESHEAAVVEMGMNAPGEIARLTEIADPSIGVITNISPAHIGNFRSMAGVRKAKGELIETMAENAASALNADDPNSLPLIRSARERLKKVLTFGRHPLADVSLVDCWSNGKTGRWAAVYFGGRELTTHVPLLGGHHVANALAAFAASALAGVAPEEIVEGIGKAKPVPMRMSPVHLPNGALVIDDSYNANPASTRAALETLAEFREKGKLVFVFADMLELGARAVAEHRKIGAMAAAAGVELMFTMGEMAALAGEEAEKRGVRVTRAGSIGVLARQVLRALKRGDTALVKGSRSMELEKVVERAVDMAGGR